MITGTLWTGCKHAKRTMGREEQHHRFELALDDRPCVVAW